MKIDIHCHTLTTKNNGEPSSRSIPDDNDSYVKFVKLREDADIGVVAVTNHNFFNREQFIKIKKANINNKILFLPGAELDVIDRGENRDRHGCNIIVSEDKIDGLVSFIEEKNLTPNNFSIDIVEFIEIAKKLNAIITVDTSLKDKEFPQEDINYILNESNSGEFCFIFEASNKKGAEIISNHGIQYRAIVGTDSKFWNEFKDDQIPEINENIVSYSGLYSFIKSYVIFGKNSTQTHSISVLPNDNGETWENDIKFEIKTGINIIVGPKASGKTVLLNSIYDQLSDISPNEIAFFGKKNSYNELVKKVELKAKSGNIDLGTKYDELITIMERCKKIDLLIIKDNFLKLKKWIDGKRDKIYSNLESMTEGDFVWNETIRDLNVKSINSILSDIKNFKSMIKRFECYNFEEDISSNFVYYTNLIISSLTEILLTSFKKMKVTKLVNESKTRLKKLLSVKGNSDEKPNNLGIYNYWLNRSILKESIDLVINTPEQESNSIFLGEVIDSENCVKNVFIKSKSFMQNSENEIKYKNYKVNWQKKATIPKYIKLLSKISSDYLSNSQKDNILKAYDTHVNNEISNFDLTAYYFYYTRDGQSEPQTPSSGEEQILLLSNVLNDKTHKYYLLDEPEKSIDNKMVYEYIMEKLKVLESFGKFILMTTHNANLATITHPKTIIYREIKCNNKNTYIGNGIETNLVNPLNGDKIKWKKTGKVLFEGNEKALELRKEYYNE